MASYAYQTHCGKKRVISDQVASEINHSAIDEITSGKPLPRRPPDLPIKILIRETLEPDPNYDEPKFTFEVLIGPQKFPQICCIDTCAEGGNYISYQLANALNELGGVTITALQGPMQTNSFFGTSAPPITHILRTELSVGRHWQPSCDFYIHELGHADLFLGIHWLKQHGCVLDTTTRNILFHGNYCKHEGAPSAIPILDSNSHNRNLRISSSENDFFSDTESDSDADADYNTLDKLQSIPCVIPLSQTNWQPPSVEEIKDEHFTTKAPKRSAPLSPNHKDVILDRKKKRWFSAKLNERKREKKKEKQRIEHVKDQEWPTNTPDRIPLRDPSKPSDIYMIGEFAMNTLHKRGYDVFAISMEDIITQHRKDDTEPDPIDILPDELKDLARIFSKHDSDQLPPLRPGHNHKIDTGGKDPDWIPHLHRMSREELDEVAKWVKQNLSKGFIEASMAPWASPILFVKKPGGGVRLCHDYRKLNAMSRKDRFPLPLIDDIMTMVAGAGCITRLDVRQAFNRVRIEPDDVEKTTFATPMGNFKQIVLPFGLTGGPATFQRFINLTLMEYLNKFCVAYMDDILIYSRNKAENIEHTRKVLLALEGAGLQCDVRKSEFFVKKTKFLGLIVSENGLEMDPEKIRVIKEWERPRNLTEVQSFVGFCNFYRRFIKNFSRVLRPLIEMSKKEFKISFNWTEHCQKAFDHIKTVVTSAPVLRHYNPTKKAIVEVDSSDYVHGGVMSQYDDEDVLHPVAFFSRKLTPAECNYEIYDKELLAIVSAFEHWRPELEGTLTPIEVFTDHKALEYFMTTKKLTRRQARWALDLSNFNFTITYKTGKTNVVPDALTRKPGDRPADDSDERQQFQFQRIFTDNKLDPRIVKELEHTASSEEEEIEEYSISPIINVDAEGNVEFDDEIKELLADRVKLAQQDDKIVERIRKRLQNGDRKDEDLTLADCKFKEDLDSGHLYIQDKLYVPESIRTEVIAAVHDTPITGHPGLAKTLFLLKKSYYWLNMHKTILRFLRNCHPCRRTKPSRDQYNGFLKPLEIADRPWQHISMDLITKLPTTLKSQYDAIAVIVCRLTKRRLFFSIQEKGFDAPTCAMLVYQQMRRQGAGVISSFVSDRGVQWDNEFWTHLCRLWNIQKKMSSAFHPETDGQSEIANQELERFLRTYCNYLQDDWDKYLIDAEAAINALPSESTKISPFMATNGYEPINPFDLEATQVLPDTSMQGKKERKKAVRFAEQAKERWEFCQENISLAQSRQEEYANKDRMPAPIYKPGDKVWVNTKNIKTKRPARKLDDRHVRAEVVEMVGSSVRLKLPDGMEALAESFHTSLLRLDPEDPLPEQHNPPEPRIFLRDDQQYPEEELHEEWEVDEVVDSRLFAYGRLKYRVKWKDERWNPDHEWRPAEDFQNSRDAVLAFHTKYPNKPAPPTLRIPQEVLDQRKQEREAAEFIRLAAARKEGEERRARLRPRNRD